MSDDAHAGSFRQDVETRGQYAVMVMNKSDARPAMVSLEVRTDSIQTRMWWRRCFRRGAGWR